MPVYQKDGSYPIIPTQADEKRILDTSVYQKDGDYPIIPTQPDEKMLGDWFFVYPPKFTEPTYGSFYYKGQKYETFEYK
jgi:hypothetical protein